ncbi:hypothetical protein SAMN05421690_1002146 [Nitrosomonas sp. Nm51]|uniref:hypothetical protein n=1 Tax=Nitrosomonas sp. Nm51 TaxID=133720 RepID=UPI0008BBABB2|nr:hypothetical protein [Nitrosomonas sp. Nm51]SEQ86210.1 hypothetical protein SAMN05421690_1002146 [Nitrosomonas sp. Nm51]
MCRAGRLGLPKITMVAFFTTDLDLTVEQIIEYYQSQVSGLAKQQLNSTFLTIQPTIAQCTPNSPAMAFIV